MRRVLITLVALVSVSLLTAPHARADSPDFALFSRGWYVHRGIMVVAEDGSALFDYNPLGNTASYVLTIQFTGVSDDGNSAFGTVVGSDDPGPYRGGLYGWIRGADIVFSLASEHTAYLQQSGTIVFLCSSGWLSEVPQPPCGA